MDDFDLAAVAFVAGVGGLIVGVVVFALAMTLFGYLGMWAGVLFAALAFLGGVAVGLHITKGA